MEGSDGCCFPQSKSGTIRQRGGGQTHASMRDANRRDEALAMLAEIQERVTLGFETVAIRGCSSDHFSRASVKGLPTIAGPGRERSRVPKTREILGLSAFSTLRFDCPRSRFV